MSESLPIVQLRNMLQHVLSCVYDSSDWHTGDCNKETGLSIPTGVQLPLLGLCDAQPAEMRALSFHHTSASCTVLLTNLSATAQDHIEYCLSLLCSLGATA